MSRTELLELLRTYGGLRRDGRHEEAEALLTKHQDHELFVSMARFGDQVTAAIVRAFVAPVSADDAKIPPTTP